MRRLLGLAVGLALVFGTSARADDPPKPPAEELKQLQKDVADAQKKLMDLSRKVRAEEDKEEKKKLQEEFQTAIDEFTKFQREAQGKAVLIAKTDPKSEVGLDAMLWALPSLRSKRAEMKELLDLAVEHHAENKKMAQVVSLLASFAGSDPKALESIEAIAAKSPHKAVKATAAFTVAEFYKSKAEPYGRPAPKDADELAKKAEDGYERILKEFADEKQFGNRTFGTAATAGLFELRNLRVGKTAPEIDGEDVDGAKFKLSDYRGKVVMLDFWGHW